MHTVFNWRLSALLANNNVMTAAGKASSSAMDFTGSWFTGGTATTTKPQVLIEPTGTTSTAWNTSGTGLGVNAHSGFAGNLIDLQTNGVTEFSVTAAGVVNATGNIIVTGDNTFISCDANSNRLGFVKKTGVLPKLAMAAGRSLTITVSSGGDISASNTFTDVFVFDASGNAVMGTGALGTTATNGFFYVDTCAGVPTGVPTAYTGRCPMVYDTTDNKLYVYNGAWKAVALA